MAEQRRRSEFFLAEGDLGAALKVFVRIKHVELLLGRDYRVVVHLVVDARRPLLHDEVSDRITLAGVARVLQLAVFEVDVRDGAIEALSDAVHAVISLLVGVAAQFLVVMVVRAAPLAVDFFGLAHVQDAQVTFSARTEHLV